MKRNAGQTLTENRLIIFFILVVAIAIFGVVNLSKAHSSSKKAKQAVKVSQKANVDKNAQLAFWIARPTVKDIQDGWYRVRQIHVGQSKYGKAVTGYEILDDRGQVTKRLVDVSEKIEQITVVPYSIAHGREHEWVLNLFDNPTLHPGHGGHLVVKTTRKYKELLFFSYVAAGGIGENH